MQKIDVPMKQAFIILAHGKFDQLEILLEALQFPSFDIYLHIDASAAIPANFACRWPGVHLLERRSLYWGDVSLVKAELEAFKAVINSCGYSHIHLLSGQDMPLASPEKIQSYFTAHEGQQFIDIRPHEKTNYPHVRCWIPFPKYLKYKSGSKVLYRMVKIINQLTYIFEKMILMPLWRGIDHDYKMSSQWVSITPDAAKYIVSRETEILSRYAHAFAPDEFFLASELWNSHFRQSIVTDNLRYIQWGRAHSPHPFTITMADYDAMMASGALFARKFDIALDPEVLDKLRF